MTNNSRYHSPYLQIALYIGIILLQPYAALAQTTPTYKDEWEVFIKVQKDTLTSVVVDLGLKRYAPQPLLPYHLSIGLKMKAPAENGLVGPTETKDIENLENRISQLLSEQGVLVRTGITTSKGVRTLHFYAQTTQIDTAVLGTAFIFYPQYKDFILRAEKDTTWSYYLQELYPSPEEYQKIKNTRVIKDLIVNGDRLTPYRPVDHFITFPTKKDAEKYAKTAKKDKFAIVELEQDTAKNERPWQLRISREDPVTPVEVDAYTLLLWRLAAEFKGQYMGWQTVVTKQSSPTVPR